jgi:nucleoporin POM152
MLNPHQLSFCLDSVKTAASLPIQINQTNPILIEIIRIDLDSNDHEIITISRKELKKLRRQADKGSGKEDTATPRTIEYPVKQPGLYRLQRVVDESNLEVQRRISDTLIVQCPSASVKAVPSDKCVGDLSNFFLQVDATPPFKIRYSKTINTADRSDIFLTIHPENLDSPLSRQRTLGAFMKLDSSNIDVSWARLKHIDVPVNETLDVTGGWQYSIDEIHDACGNIVNYTREEDSGSARAYKATTSTTQIFTVHGRPKALISPCTTEKPLKAAKGSLQRLPLQFSHMQSHNLDSAQFHISYSFTPESTENNASGGDPVVRVVHATVKSNGDGLEIRDPGLYRLLSVASDFCRGEVREPAACLLLNPAEPDLSIKAEKIYDKCAGNSIGLMVDLDFTGIPPFEVHYTEQRHGGLIQHRLLKTELMRTQLELRPLDAGHYTYEFIDVRDQIYVLRSLNDKTFKLEQDVKPSASAYLLSHSLTKDVCNGDSASFLVNMSGEGPWTLEYELVHEGKRKKQNVEGIQRDMYTLIIDRLTDGGRHVLSLVSVTDRNGCKTFLEQEAGIQVRHQRPSVSFGELDGKRNVLSLEGQSVALPIRLSGQEPWMVTYRRSQDKEGISTIVHLRSKNDRIEVNQADAYELLDVRDNSCPGSVDQKASSFDVRWIPRPAIQIAESLSVERNGDKYVKKAVCEGDQDAMEVSLTGNPPYHLQYKVNIKPERGSSSLNIRKENPGLSTSSIRMETSKAGLYEYKFEKLGDQSYNYDRHNFSPLVVQQKVHARPSASFVSAGKSYSYCKEEDSGDEVIPIALVGTPPFSVEVGIRHHATTKPEVVTVPNIEARYYNFHIPRGVLALGTHTVALRKVQDFNGCQRVTEFDGPRVHVNVVDIPSIHPMETRTDYCVGDRISYTLAGTPPFNVFYTFEGIDLKATASTTQFRRVAERPGNFTITAVSDKASTDSCRARTGISKIIHEMPSVRISKGMVSEVDIHEGGVADILFEFSGTPPFEFT